MTTLETKFLQALKAEAFGGLTFTGDINPEGMNKAQKSGVVSSLVQKNVLTVADDGMIGIIPEDGDVTEANWEFISSEVQALIERVS